MASQEIVDEMSNIAYKEILKRDTSKEVSGVFKVQKYLRETKKHEKLSCYLAANLLLLNYLTVDELLACKKTCLSGEFSGAGYNEGA